MNRTLPVVAALAAIALSGCLNEFPEEHSRVFIDRMDVAATAVDVATIHLDLTIRVTNTGGTSDTLHAEVRSIDTTTGFLENTSRAAVGQVGAGESANVTIPLALPKSDGYRFDVNIWEGDKNIAGRSLGIRNVKALPVSSHETDLVFAGMDFLVRNLTGRDVAIEVAAYLTNEGARDSTPVRLQIKAREADTSLLAREADLNVGAIPSGATHRFDATLTLPDGHNYLMEAVLWQGDIIVGRGDGAVQLLPTFERSAGSETVHKDPELERFIVGDGDHAESPGGGRSYDRGYEDDHDSAATPGVPVALLATALVAFAAWRRRQ